MKDWLSLFCFLTCLIEMIFLKVLECDVAFIDALPLAGNDDDDAVSERLAPN